MRSLYMGSIFSAADRLKSLPCLPYRLLVAPSGIMDIDSLIRHHTRKQKLPFAIGTPLSANQINLLVKNFGSVVKGQIRGRYPISWVIQSQAIDNIISDLPSHEKASVLRNYIGAFHFTKDVHLVELRYPKSVVNSLELYSPTFLDYGIGVFGRVTSTQDGWGRAVNLQILQDGLPEAVHRPIPLTEDFTLIDIGKISDPVPVLDWEELNKTLPFPVTYNSLGQLENLLFESFFEK